MLAHDFAAISVSMRTWCMLEEHDLARLQNAASCANFKAADVNKLEILFLHYSGDVELAFSRAQAHTQEHGFDPDLHVICLVCLYQNNQFEDALTFLRQLDDAQVNNMNRADYWQLLAMIRWAANDMSTLESAADRALALAPDNAAVLQTALGMYIELGAKDKIETVRARLANMPEAQGYAYSLCMLALGEHELGWRQMESRYETDEAHRYINQGLKALPRWKGENLTGLRLLVSAEQGLGDTIQMARYLSMLDTLGVEGLLLETQPETLTLLQYNFPKIPMVERQWAKAPSLPFDRWTGMMSLPHFLRAWGKNTPGRSGYLRVPPENAHYWQERVAQLSSPNQLKVGLAWSGQPTHRADRRRSIPFELMMRQVRGIRANFFALQTHVPQVLPANVMNVADEMITLADTAALIEQMDLVITVDTSVVHIAGALGKETWLLLPKRYEWRWGMEGEGNDWYDTVRVIRQAKHTDWESVLCEVFEHRLRGQFKF